MMSSLLRINELLYIIQIMGESWSATALTAPGCHAEECMPYPLAVSRALAGYLYENRNEEWQRFMPCTFFKNCRRNANARATLR